MFGHFMFRSSHKMIRLMDNINTHRVCFLIFIFIYLLGWVLIAACRIFDLHCSMQDLWLQHVGSFPSQVLLHWQCGFLATGSPQKSPSKVLEIIFLQFLDSHCICFKMTDVFQSSVFSWPLSPLCSSDCRSEGSTWGSPLCRRQIPL